MGDPDNTTPVEVPAEMSVFRQFFNSLDDLKNLPPSVKRRIKSLKKLQFETTKIEAEFYREVHQLECKYQERYTPLYELRNKITTGAYEPNDEECEWESEEDSDEEGADEQNNKKPEVVEAADDNTKGIPEFWLKVFNNVDILVDMVQTHDEAILKHLEDLKVTFSEKDPMGFTLHFIFSPNDFFTNKVLTKEYIMKCEPSDGDPFGFEGPEIYKCVGCNIDWKPGKNVTDKEVVKTQKHASKGTVRSTVDTDQADSFFNFFNPPEIPEDPNAQIETNLQDLISMDFEIGHYIREKIIPRAVLYFTGEALEDDGDVEDESNDDDDDDDEDDEEYGSDNEVQSKEDCKQQ
uniref:Nucleosome assembly protein 1-like 1 n=1 Tax=Lepeophtheirus salmonis TaxID=72036 RepID=D3PIP9_LEPSM|nr:Nucleosome assembly protein 1-like 1 [Lepeophtheirus salmonis]